MTPQALHQMLLFADLPIPPAPPEAPPKPPRRRGTVAAAVLRMLQLALDFNARDDAPPAVEIDALADDEDTPYDFPQHRRAVAGMEPPPKTSAPASVWAFATAVRQSDAPRLRARDAAPQKPPAKVGAVIRHQADGVTRSIGAQYPANRWDEERAERERIRRAKQRPPKPTRKAKTRSKKLLELIGGDAED